MESMPKSKVELTEGEWAIMKAVWQSEPCAAPTVQESLQATRNWSYSTVRTLMDRMVGKGLLKAAKIRNLTLYSAAVTSEQAQQGEVLYALRNAFNGALTPMVQCLLETNDLNADDLEELEKLIRQKRRKVKS
jgi:BlaI family transcriptional regulator, penicillinase repressor